MSFATSKGALRFSCDGSTCSAAAPCVFGGADWAR